MERRRKNCSVDESRDSEGGDGLRGRGVRAVTIAVPHRQSSRERAPFVKGRATRYRRSAYRAVGSLCERESLVNSTKKSECTLAAQTAPPRVHPLLEGILHDQRIYDDLPRLPDSMCPLLCLCLMILLPDRL